MQYRGYVQSNVFPVPPRSVFCTGFVMLFVGVTAPTARVEIHNHPNVSSICCNPVFGSNHDQSTEMYGPHSPTYHFIFAHKSIDSSHIHQVRLSKVSQTSCGLWQNVRVDIFGAVCSGHSDWNSTVQPLTNFTPSLHCKVLHWTKGQKTMQYFENWDMSLESTPRLSMFNLYSNFPWPHYCKLCHDNQSQTNLSPYSLDMPHPFAILNLPILQLLIFVMA